MAEIMYRVFMTDEQWQHLYRHTRRSLRNLKGLRSALETATKVLDPDYRTDDWAVVMTVLEWQYVDVVLRRANKLEGRLRATSKDSYMAGEPF